MACVSTEGQLPKWVQRRLSWREGQKEHNGAPVAGDVLIFSKNPVRMFQTANLGTDILC